MKTCTLCNRPKPINQFHRNKKSRDGHVNQCRTCRNELQRSNRTRYYPKVVQWKKDNPDKVAESSRRQNYKRKFGITPLEYHALLLAQDGVCRICGLLDQANRRLAVDHCHETKTVRGLLCMNCNQGLGKFKDNPQLLRLAAVYLEV